MRIDDILADIERYPSSGGQAFETFVLFLLQEFLTKENKPLKFGSNLEYSFIDAVAEQGIPSFQNTSAIEGRTLIEIKYNLTDRRLINVKNILSKILLSDVRFDNLLVISNKSLPATTTEVLKRNLKDIYPSANVFFWGPEQLNSIIHKHQVKSKEIAANLFTFKLNQLLSKSIRDWKHDRDERLLELTDRYKRGQMSLFLGAGVSSSAGMVDWKTLLDSLFVNLTSTVLNTENRFSEKDILQISKRFNKIQDSSSLALARYLRAGFAKDTKGDEKFIEAVRKSLYDLRDKDIPIDSPLFNSISKLCMPERTGSKIRSVLTYNFDDLLEKCLEDRNIRYHSIYADTNLYSLDELPVYHVHGFLPEDISNYDDLDKNTFVFSEEGYHKIYSDPYHWSNLIQLNSLREYNCVLIGLSMTDPNLRRLLDLAVKNPEGPRHFVFMKRSNLNAFIYDPEKDENGNISKKNKAIDNDDAALAFVESHHSLQEQIFKELGVSVIWYEQYDEIPSLLTKVYESSISN